MPRTRSRGNATVALLAGVLASLTPGHDIHSQERGSRPAAAQPIDVGLDHLYIVLDSSTYAAIAASEFIPTRLGALPHRANSSGDRSWAGVSLQGRHTYVEFFTPGNFGPAGSSAVAFNVAASGDAERLRTILAGDGASPYDLVFRTGMRAGKEEPWFYSLRRADSITTVYRWVMEYHPEFTRWEGSDTVLADGRAGRRRIARRRHDAALPFLDVVGITLGMPDRDRERLRRELLAFGWEVTALDDAAGFTATSPRARIVAQRDTTHRAGIRSLTLALSRPFTRPVTVPLGASSLRVEDSLAIWSITPVPLTP